MLDNHCDSGTKEVMSMKDIDTKLSLINPNYHSTLIGEWDAGNFNVLYGMQQDVEQKPMYKAFESETPSRHLSVVFNLFVFMQIFNMICSRKINDEINIFEGIFSNPSFIIVWTVIVIVQVFCCQLFGRFVSVHVNGLTSTQWIYCMLISLVTFPINFFLKFVPDRVCLTLGDEDPADVEEAGKDYELLRAKGEKQAKELELRKQQA